MTPLERAARAVREELPIETDFGDGTFVVSPTMHDDDFRNIARAVLEAIREPSGEIVKALQNIADDKDFRLAVSTTGLSDFEAIHAWQAMIDAALAEGA